MLRDRHLDTNDAAVLDLDDSLATTAPQRGELKPEAEPQLPFVDAPAAERHAPEAPQKSADEDRERKPEGLLRRRPLATSFAALLIAAAVGGSYLWYDSGSHFESTDDAFIAARQIAIAPKIAGYVSAVPVTDNQHVVAGETIARIDDRDYRVALAQAEAQVATAEASIDNIDQQLSVQAAQIESSKAQVDQAQATLTFAQQQAARYETLAKTGAGSVQNAQQYSSQLGQQQAAVKSAQAATVVAERQIGALKAQRASAEASLAQAKAQRDQARLNLSYANVVAAEPGRVVSLTAAPGEYAAAGTSLSMFVPDEEWVTANFKETQLDAMRPGQPVTLEIDAYPERRIRGHVASVQPGSGTAFSLLPAQNATGNYVKVVQRVPVKIVIDNLPADVALGPGMSVVPDVRVDASPSLYERLTAWFGGRKA